MNDAANGKRWELDDELETGEPIEEEDAPKPVKKKIRARVVPFDGHAPRRSDRANDEADRSEPEGQPAGQMVLTTAKYMPREALEPEPRRTGQSRKNKVQQPEQASSSLEGKVVNSGKWGGMLAMTVAVVWFMAGMMNDTIFFYPPILFIVGLVAFMKDTFKGD